MKKIKNKNLIELYRRIEALNSLSSQKEVNKIRSRIDMLHFNDPEAKEVIKLYEKS